MNQVDHHPSALAGARNPQSAIDALIAQVANSSEPPRTGTYWIGSDVLVCQPGTDWENASHTSPRQNTGKTWVVTEFAAELSWAFEALAQIIAEHDVYTSDDRRDFYGQLAEHAIEFLGRSSAGEQTFESRSRARSLLFFTLQNARRLLDQTVSASR
ncbi:MAG: hypothetical protein AAF515_07360 [Pseudomonadota bacterium]